MKQYIVEWRPANREESYLYTEKIKPLQIRTPAQLHRPDQSTTWRPIVVGTIDPETGIVLYLEDQQ